MNNDDELESLAKRFLTLPDIDIGDTPLETLVILKQQSFEMKQLYDEMVKLKLEIESVLGRT